MTIINFGSKLDLFEEYLSSIPALTTLFTGGISAGKPSVKLNGLTLYFSVIGNNTLIDSSRKESRNLKKRAMIEFVIVTNKKDIPQVEIYEALDVLSNSICNKNISLDGFIINSITENNQTGVVVDSGENPLLIAMYEIDYKNNY